MQCVDMVVMGGGPAGAISAWLAARDGLRVVLVDPDMDRPFARIEGLSPRLHRWLAGQGLLPGPGVIMGPLPRQVEWAGLTTTANAEYVVDRAGLDRHLRAMARAVGVQVVRGNARPLPPGQGVGADLGHGDSVKARWCLDARGRAAGRPGQGGQPRAAATVALCGWVDADPQAPGVRVTSCAEGWLWQVALPDGRLWVQAVTDAAPRHGNTDAAPSAPGLRLSRMLMATGLSGGLAQDNLLLREAAPRLAPPPPDDLHHLRIGDAGAAMDPLAGHGQFWAVSSALAAAAVRRSLDADPQSEGLCRRFWAERSTATALRQARIGRDFIRTETRFAEAPFWAARRAFPDDAPAHDTRPDFGIARRVLVCDGRLVEIDALLTPQSPDGVGWFGTTPAVGVWQAYRQGGLPALHDRWGHAAGRLAQALAQAAAPSVQPGQAQEAPRLIAVQDRDYGLPVQPDPAPAH